MESVNIDLGKNPEEMNQEELGMMIYKIIEDLENGILHMTDHVHSILKNASIALMAHHFDLECACAKKQRGVEREFIYAPAKA